MEARFQGPGAEPVDLPQGALPVALSPLPESSIVLLFSSSELAAWIQGCVCAWQQPL